jgi:cardiolipin synthase
MNAAAIKGYSTCNTVELIKGGTEYFSLLIQLIHNAHKTIHLQVYLLDDDETGRMVIAALKAAAGRGVKVYLMLDGYASQSLPDKFIADILAAGISFRFFEPFLKSQYFYFGRRMHHKILVADAMHALVGGMNIADRYNQLHGTAAWLDFALYVQGEVAKELCQLCRNEWKGYLKNAAAAPCEQVRPATAPAPQQIPVKICRNDWVRRKNQVSAIYIEMLQNASSHVTILCSYFLPGRIIRRQIVQAARRGIDVKIITTGRSDVRIVKYAERWFYDYLLRNNVKLYEYQDNILHGKIAECDGKWMTAGSYNINNLSAYASIELNLAVKNEAFGLETKKLLQQIIDNSCLPITKETHSRSKNIFTQFVRWFSYQFIRAVFYLFTFYYKQRS